MLNQGVLLAEPSMQFLEARASGSPLTLRSSLLLFMLGALSNLPLDLCTPSERDFGPIDSKASPRIIPVLL